MENSRLTVHELFAFLVIVGVIFYAGYLVGNINGFKEGAKLIDREVSTTKEKQ